MNKTTRLLLALVGIAAIATTYLIRTTLAVEIPLFALGLIAVGVAIFAGRGSRRTRRVDPASDDGVGPAQNEEETGEGAPSVDLPEHTLRQISIYREPEDTSHDVWVAAIIEMPDDGTVYEDVRVAFAVLDVDNNVIERNIDEITLRPGRNLARADFSDFLGAEQPRVSVHLDGRGARAVPLSDIGRLEISPLEVERGDGYVELRAEITHRTGDDDREQWLDTTVVVRGADGEVFDCAEDSFGYQPAGVVFPYRAYLDAIPAEGEPTFELFVETRRAR